MGDTQKRRPAHAVLMDELKTMAMEYRELVGQVLHLDDEDMISRVSQEFPILMLLGLISLVTNVLHKMVIPEKDLSAVISSLEESAVIANFTRRGEDKSPAWAMITDVISGLRSVRVDKL